MSNGPVIGIDLGTTFSAVAHINRHGKPELLANSDGARTTPSVVYFEEQGPPIVGSAARNVALSDPERVVMCIKREMGNPSYRLNLDGNEYLPESIAAIILRQLKSDASARLGTEVQRAVISVPAYFKDSQRTATITAGELAGLEVIATINEPTAAAIAYGLNKDEGDQTVLVYDFGGGTFDVTVLKIANNEFTVMSTDGDSGLGGVDIDQRVADYLAEQFSTQRGTDLGADPFTKLDLMTRAEQAKKDLSGRQSVMVTLGSGREALRVDLDRSRLAELTGDLIERTRVCMERAVDAASLSWPKIDSVLLVGGSSRMTAVREMIQQVCGKTVTLDVNPDEAVACGAAVRATLSDVREVVSEGPSATTPADPATSRPPEIGIVVRDVATHSLGVRAFSEDGKPINSIILPRFTELPCERQRTYATRADNQSQIEVEILQGDNPDPFSPEVESIGRLTMDGLPPRPAGGVLLALTLRYDVDGVVEVEAEELEGGRRLRQQLLRKSGELDPEVIEGLRRDLDELEQPDESASEERDQDDAAAGEDEGDDERPTDTPSEDGAEEETGSSEEADEREELHEPEHSTGELERVDKDGALASPNYYELLGVEPSATEQEIEAALEGSEHYWSERREQASGAEEESVAEAGLAMIGEARATLLDPAVRSRLDRELGIGDGTAQGEGTSEAPQGEGTSEASQT